MPPLRRLLLALAVTSVAVAVLAVGARASRPAADLGAVVRWWPLAGALVVLAIAVVLALGVLAGIRPGDVGAGTAGRGSGVSSALLLVVLVVASTLLPPVEETGTDGAGGIGPLGFGLPEVGEVEVPRDVVLAPSATAAVLLVLAAVLVLLARRRRGPAVSPARDVEVLGRAAARATRRLRGAADPREGVLLAFASLEDDLARHGAGRRPSETQAAWVERLLLEHGAAPAPAGRLRSAFERARFSTGPVTAADHAVALEDLASLRAHAEPT